MDKLTFIFLSILLCGSAVATRPRPRTTGRATLADDGGVCSAIVGVQNYPCHEHNVTTGDGYILSLQNIPFGQSGNAATGPRPPVLLHHGVLTDAVTWLLSPPEQSLALLLADNGFDVWLVNARGTKYSLGHTSLSSNDPAFWDWSWDELVAYDLPATFQYIYDQTSQKLHYVGHSMGTLIAFAGFSKGQLVDKLRSAAMLCPIAYIGHMTSPIATNVAQTLLNQTSYWLKIAEFNPTDEAVLQLLLQICKQKHINCLDLMTSYTGQNCCLNSSIISSFLKNEPQSTSTKNMIHFAQMAQDGMIKMYDYGDVKENVKHYGTPVPPSYNMTNIPNDVPLFLAYGGKDALSVSEDVKLLLDSLHEHEQDKLVVQYTENYAHADFIMGFNATQVVYDPLMAFLRLH
ncbi:triacylglycerol lipase 2-like [Sesamum indicum]|uniref:Lipase n=1 Tax=Sesamum indicum TaxID=4182 RepID=A0A8M8VEQ2_SESIN|nr:triacylglycerol lipase 2-like [Sesamum indicum]